MSKSRRNVQVFNMSFLDLMTNFLGAMTILFLLSMKHYSEKPCPQMERSEQVFLDTVSGKIFGTLAPGISRLRLDDSLMVRIADFQTMPQPGQPCPPACNRPHYACSRIHCDDRACSKGAVVACSRTHCDDAACAKNNGCNRKHCDTDCPTAAPCAQIHCNDPACPNNQTVVGYLPPGNRFILNWESKGAFDLIVEKGGRKLKKSMNNRAWGEWYDDRTKLFKGQGQTEEGVKIAENGRYKIYAKNRSDRSQTATLALTSSVGKRFSKETQFTLPADSDEILLAEVEVSASGIKVIDLKK